MTLRMLDLFSGLGGASRAMKERGWDVITVDNEPSFHPSIVADIKTFTYQGSPVDLLWASPPCTDFTRESLPLQFTCNRNGKPVPDLTLCMATKRLIQNVRPRFWVVENVRGAVKYLNPILGTYRKRSGSRYLWGEFPIFDCNPKFGKWRLPPSKDRAAKRAVIPYQISLALALAIEGDTS